MAYVRDDESFMRDNIQFRAWDAELKEVRATLKRFQYGNVRREIDQLNERARDLQRKMEGFQARSPIRLG